jgi:hypothetical protein
VGPSLTVPSATNEVLGTKKWSLGPSFVFLTEQGPWVTGFLVSNAWSIGGESGRDDVNAGFLQPWLYYNFPTGFWTVPVGIGVGKTFQIGSRFLNFQVAAFYNVEKPTGSADWTIRSQVQFLFPR